ncbi:MAG: hypothetical protein MRJ93_10425 [Nitrososphaeraceae archaeon]|nr:hypothetical protein [Nitrososphaeraceae archaeon]
MWSFFRKVHGKKINQNKEKDKKTSQSKKNQTFSINDFPDRMSKINQAYPLLKEKESSILTKITDLIKNGRYKESRQLFDELNNIRKDIIILENSKKIIEQTLIQISLIHDVGDALETIEPISNRQNRQSRDIKTNEKKYDKKTGREPDIKNFTQNAVKDILKDDYKDIDFKSIEQIDNSF